MLKYLYIAGGGALGTICRFWLVTYLEQKYTSTFPFGTLTVNLFGSLMIGFLFGLMSANGIIEEKWRLLLFIGFLGGFTTFSSFSLENMKLLQNGFSSTAIVYIIASNLFGILLAFLGYFISLKFK